MILIIPREQNVNYQISESMRICTIFRLDPSEYSRFVEILVNENNLNNDLCHAFVCLPLCLDVLCECMCM